MCVSKMTILGSDNGLSPGRCQTIIWANPGIVNWTLGNKLQWNLNWNLYIFIQQNVFENVFRKMATILFLTQCVKFLQLIQRLGTCKFHQLHAQYSIELQRLDNLTWWYQDSSPSLIYMVFPWKIYVVAAGLYKQFCLRKSTWKIKCKSLQNVSHFSHSQAQQPLPVTDNWELS